MKTDWVNCPICGEPDMKRESDDDGFIITCTNLCCASNGGDNHSVLKIESSPFTARMAEEMLERRAALDAANAIIAQQADEMATLQAALDRMTAWKDNAYQTISELRDAAYGKGWTCCKSQGETIAEVKRLKAHADDTMSIASIHLRTQLAAAQDMADWVRHRVIDHVKDGRGVMTVFDRNRMEELGKALARFDEAKAALS